MINIFHFFVETFFSSKMSEVFSNFRYAGRETSGDSTMVEPGNTKWGRYHCTIDLLFDWFGLACFAN
jgi:hypothetical protein